LAAFGNFDHMGNAAYDAAKPPSSGSPERSRVASAATASASTWSRLARSYERVREVFSQEFLDTQIARIPLRRMPGPNDVAALIEFLLQPESDQISGEVVRVAGGLSSLLKTEIGNRNNFLGGKSCVD